MFARKVHNLRHFGFRNFIGVDSALSDSIVVDVQHDSCGRFAILVEEALENVNHEFHRRVIVIEQQNAVKVRPLGLRLCLGDDRGSGTFIALALSIVVRRARTRSIGRIDFTSLVKSHHDTGSSRRFEGGAPHDSAPMILGQ